MTEIDEEWIHPLLTTVSELETEARKRRDAYKRQSVRKSSVEEYYNEGWEFDKELKRLTRIKRIKSHDEMFENRLWHCLFKMGYHEMNKGRSFHIKIKRHGAEDLEKQIDVFAKDDETVIIAECKSSKSVTKRSLQKDIEEFANLKGPIAKSIRKHYGHDYNPKILWLFVTNNIIWSKPDKERANGQKIRIMTERELRYLNQIARHLGRAARYQFLAEYFKGEKIPELAGYKVPAVKGKLGEKNYYSFVTTPGHLLKIAFINHRSLNDPQGAPTYQRLIKRSRIRQIEKYVINGGYFPTNLLVNFKYDLRFEQINKDEKTDVRYGYLYLPNKYQSAWVIDGQHRLFGYANLNDDFLSQNIFVVAFEKMPIEEEANLFVTINHEQKSVPKNLLDDLEGELKWGSDIPSERIGSIGARLISVINSDLGEPFYNRVTQQGIPTTQDTCLTMPELKNGIRRSGLIGTAINNNKNYDLGPFSGIDDAQTLDRARRGINQFFSLIRDANPEKWVEGRAGNICINLGVQGYFRLFGFLIQYAEQMKGINPKEMDPEEIVMEVQEYLRPMLTFLHDANESDLDRFKVKYGSGGPNEYLYHLCKIVNDEYPDFKPDDFTKWEKEHSEEMIQKADSKLNDLQVKIQKTIFGKLKQEFGEKDYLYKGVRDTNMIGDINKRRAEAVMEGEEELPVDNYFMMSEYAEIVRKNWNLFEAVFAIPEKGEEHKTGKKVLTSWMIKINGIRRVPAHRTEERVYQAWHFDYIEWICEEFNKKYYADIESISGDDIY